MFAIHIHTLFHVDSLRRNTQRLCKVAGLERADLRRSACAPKLQMNYETDRWFLTEITRNPSQGDSERLLIWFSPLWSMALWMGKMSHYETPECALLCSQLKGMLLSVRGSPLICEMLCAWSNDQAYDLRQCVWALWCSCHFKVLSEMFGTAGWGDQPWWVPLWSPKFTYLWQCACPLSSILFSQLVLKGCILSTNTYQDTGSRSVSPQLTLTPHHWTEQRYNTWQEVEKLHHITRRWGRWSAWWRQTERTLIILNAFIFFLSVWHWLWISNDIIIVQPEDSGSLVN